MTWVKIDGQCGLSGCYGMVIITVQRCTAISTWLKPSYSGGWGYPAALSISHKRRGMPSQYRQAE